MTKDRQICFRRSLHYFYELSVAVCCIRHVAFIRSIAVGILWRILVRCVLWAVWCIWCVAWIWSIAHVRCVTWILWTVGCIWWICAVRIILRHTEMSSFYIRLHCIVSLIFLKLFINRMTTIWCYHKKFLTFFQKSLKTQMYLFRIVGYNTKTKISFNIFYRNITSALQM